MPRLLLASGSDIRARIMRNAAIPIELRTTRIDEDGYRQSMTAEGLSPRDMADHLAEIKAMKVAARAPDALVLGCDQILDFNGTTLAKPVTPDEAVAQILMMSDRTHALHSAVVLIEHGTPAWRHVETARLTMRPLSEAYVADYVARNWDSIRHCVGGYQLESEGVRLFSRVDGDYFTILGLPLLPLLNHLALREVIAT
ncbi:MAG: Maf family protein [Tropicimonas sp.]|uniref:Maf family protein n=1 Tax=Tropicimonas sp. TaxID=2067044 RepID=UPI003A845D1C